MVLEPLVDDDVCGGRHWGVERVAGGRCVVVIVGCGRVGVGGEEVGLFLHEWEKGGSKV